MDNKTKVDFLIALAFTGQFFRENYDVTTDESDKLEALMLSLKGKFKELESSTTDESTFEWFSRSVNTYVLNNDSN